MSSSPGHLWGDVLDRSREVADPDAGEISTLGHLNEGNQDGDACPSAAVGSASMFGEIDWVERDAAARAKHKLGANLGALLPFPDLLSLGSLSGCFRPSLFVLSLL